MPAYVFKTILDRATQQNITPKMEQNAINWFRTQAKTVAVDPTRLLQSQRSRLTMKPMIGTMYVFHYDPKMKKKLPYYDSFPLVIPFDSIRTNGPITVGQQGFMGLNLHYLPPILRARLLDNLYTFVSNEKLDQTTRFEISYKLLKRVSQLKYFKPCVKQYLFSHMRSKFFYIEPSEWDMAAFLNIARFQKASQKQVWEDSRNAI